MEYNLQGIRIKNLPFNLTKKGDILAHEGPILSHFVSDNGSDYLMFWVDQDKESNRWLLFFVSSENLKRYFNTVITLRELVLYNQKDFVYFIDIDSNVDYKNIIRKAVKDFPMEYAPDERSFFNSDFATDYRVDL
ncbi:MAG: hypothetical protein HYU68_10420 [Bacteroidetes bacterium]|nr:hypothetical protein [Bacteroidota bacterium]